MKTNLSRRSFLTTTTAGAAVAPLTTWAKPERVIGANGDLRIAVAGIRSKGNGHLRSLLKQKGVRVVALCDPDSEILNARLTKAREVHPECKGYADFRKMCEDPDIDGVVIATPNHLHTIISLWAIAHDKHVYVEKPVSHNILEGKLLTAAMEKKPGLMIQHGMQRRSDTGWQEAIAWLNEGHLGKVLYSRGFCYKPRKSIGMVEPGVPVPKTVNYNLWSGPREVMPLRRRQFHYDWHWQWPYGNGDIGNQGPHQMDVARWVLGQDYVAPRVISLGGRFGYQDNGDTANTQIAFFDYKPAPLIFEVRGLPNKGLDWGKGMSNYRGVRVGNVVECEGGTIAESKAYDKDGKMMRKFGITNGRGHMENWLESMRTGKQLDVCSVREGSVSAALCHMANTSLRLGAHASAEQAKEAMAFEGGMAETYERFAEHLADNEVDIEKHQSQLGAWLSIDPETEEFSGMHADEANAMAKGEYRDGFELPVI